MKSKRERGRKKNMNITYLFLFKNISWPPSPHITWVRGGIHVYMAYTPRIPRMHLKPSYFELGHLSRNLVYELGH